MHSANLTYSTRTAWFWAATSLLIRLPQELHAPTAAWPWEVRISCESHRAARELAEQLEQEGSSVERRWRHLIVGTASKEEAEALAARLHGEVEPGGELVWETVPGNPFAVFGGLGGSGTPLG